MCRYLLYFAIAVLTFGLGDLSASKFLFKSKASVVIVKRSEEILLVKTQVPKQINLFPKADYGQIQPLTKKVSDFTCKDAALSPIWKKLQRESYFSEVKEEIARREIRNCDEIFSVMFADLNNDNILEATVRGNNGMPFCGATGNCSMWILQKKNGRYKIILDAGSVEKISLENKLPNKYPDAQTRYRYGSGEYYIETYKFNGAKYQLNKCEKETTMPDGKTYLSSNKLSACQ